MNTGELDFESALKQLEDIAKKLESNDVSLEESIKLFEDGIHLTKFCSQKLSNAKQKITLLSEFESSDENDD